MADSEFKPKPDPDPMLLNLIFVISTHLQGCEKAAELDSVQSPCRASQLGRTDSKTNKSKEMLGCGFGSLLLKVGNMDPTRTSTF